MLKHDEQFCNKFILVISLSVLHNLMVIKLFSDLYLAKFLNTSAKLFFPCKCRHTPIERLTYPRASFVTRPMWFSMQIEMFACHYANKSNGASHRDNAAVINEPPRSASEAHRARVHRESQRRDIFSRPTAVTDGWQDRAVKVAPGATLTAALLIARVPSLRADNTGEEVENVKFIASERESEGRRICLTISFHHLRTTTSDTKWD